MENFREYLSKGSIKGNLDRTSRHIKRNNLESFPDEIPQILLIQPEDGITLATYLGQQDVDLEKVEILPGVREIDV